MKEKPNHVLWDINGFKINSSLCVLSLCVCVCVFLKKKTIIVIKMVVGSNNKMGVLIKEPESPDPRTARP